LVQALQDSSFEVRFQAGEALRQIDPLWKSEALTHVITEAERLVADPTKDRDLRRNTALLLERLAEPPLQASPLLRQALLGDNQQLLNLHIEALYATNWPSNVRVECLASLVGYQQDYNVRIAAAEALGKMGRAASNACTALESALQDEWPFVRASAAKTLGQIGLPRDRVVGLLEGALHDESTQVQVEAAAALWELGAADAEGIRPVLVQGLGHKLTRVKERATEVLEQMKTPTPASP
jgi:HEAT repeat protein